MIKITSKARGADNDSSNNQVKISFSLNENPLKNMNITDNLLTNENVARARATAELLKNGHIAKRITFKTYHISKINIANIVLIDNIKYIIIGIKESLKGVKATIQITAERYER